MSSTTSVVARADLDLSSLSAPVPTGDRQGEGSTSACISVTEQPGLVTIRVAPRRDPRGPRAIGAGFAVTAGGLVLWTLLGLPVAGYLVTAPLLGVLVYGLSLGWDRDREELAATEHLSRTPRSVLLCRTGGGLVRRVVLAASQVRSLEIRAVASNEDLCLATPDGSLRIGRGLRREELEWLHETLNRAPRPGFFYH